MLNVIYDVTDIKKNLYCNAGSHAVKLIIPLAARLHMVHTGGELLGRETSHMLQDDRCWNASSLFLMAS